MSISSDQAKNLEGKKEKVSFPSSFAAQWGVLHGLGTARSAAVATEKSQDPRWEQAEGKNDLRTTPAFCVSAYKV